MIVVVNVKGLLKAMEKVVLLSAKSSKKGLLKAMKKVVLLSGRELRKGVCSMESNTFQDSHS